MTGATVAAIEPGGAGGDRGGGVGRFRRGAAAERVGGAVGIAAGDGALDAGRRRCR